MHTDTLRPCRNGLGVGVGPTSRVADATDRRTDVRWAKGATLTCGEVGLDPTSLAGQRCDLLNGKLASEPSYAGPVSFLRIAGQNAGSPRWPGLTGRSRQLLIGGVLVGGPPREARVAVPSHALSMSLGHSGSVLVRAEPLVWQLRDATPRQIAFERRFYIVSACQERVSAGHPSAEC
jgi:hypothetical protein